MFRPLYFDTVFSKERVQTANLTLSAQKHMQQYNNPGRLLGTTSLKAINTKSMQTKQIK